MRRRCRTCVASSPSWTLFQAVVAVVAVASGPRSGRAAPPRPWDGRRWGAQRWGARGWGSRCGPEQVIQQGQ